MRRFSLWFGIVIGAIILWIGLVTQAEATPRILRPGTKPGIYQFSIGTALNFVHYGFSSGVGAGGYISNTIGYHFGGRASGPALGGNFDLGFGPGGVALIFAPRFWWDIQIPGMAIYIAPYIQPGLALYIAQGGAAPTFNLQFGAEGRVILFDRLILSIRPIGFQMDIGQAFLFSMHIMHFGVGVSF